MSRILILRPDCPRRRLERLDELNPLLYTRLSCQRVRVKNRILVLRPDYPRCRFECPDELNPFLSPLHKKYTKYPDFIVISFIHPYFSYRFRMPISILIYDD